MYPVNTLHLITELGTGGAQSALLNLLRCHDRTRYRPSVACFYNADRSIAHQIRALGIEVIDLGMARRYRLDALWRLYRLLRLKRPSILQCWLFHADITGRLIGYLARIPIIITSRRNVRIGGAWRGLAKRFTRSLDDRTIAVCRLSRKTEIERTGADHTKVITIYNGIEPLPVANTKTLNRLRFNLGLPDEAPVVVCISRLHAQKGHDNLFDAWNLVNAVYPEAHLLIIGDGDLRSRLHANVKIHPSHNTIHFLGQRDDVPELLTQSNLLVLPSLSEGLPNVLLEAMVAGRPVVATNVGGIPELVIDGKTGLLVPPGNPAALSHAIITLLNNPERARSMGYAGRERVQKHFSIEKMVRQTENLYEELLRSKESLH